MLQNIMKNNQKNKKNPFKKRYGSQPVIDYSEKRELDLNCEQGLHENKPKQEHN